MPLPLATAFTKRQTIAFILISLFATTVLFLVAVGFLPGTSAAGADPFPPTGVSNDSTESHARAANAYGKLPINFASNRGQTNGRVRFMARGLGYSVFLTADEAVFALRADARTEWDRAELESLSPNPNGEAPSTGTFNVVRMRLIGANKKARIRGLDELPGKLNYFIGSDSGKWHKNVPTYSQVRYRNAYPGIDLVYHGNQHELEYDFIVAPGVSPQRIKLAFEGVKKIAVDRDGDLILTTATGAVRQRKPVAYQEVNGARKEIAARYRVRGDKVSFEVGAYDKTKKLIIDPVLVYSSFLGGSDGELGMGIAVDSQGSAYLTGSTASADFPLVGSAQNVIGAFEDAFVVKLNPAGTALIYATYLGANGGDVGNAIAVDAQGSAYVAGVTGSGSFPTTGAFQASKDGSLDGFVTKLSPSGDSLVYSTFLGGNNSDTAYGIAIDASGSAYVTGRTDSTRLFLFLPLQRNGSPVYKSETSGGLWSPSSGGLTASTVNAFAIDPVTSNTVYAATNYGVFKSTDAGANWVLTGTASSTDLPTNAVVVDPSNPNIVYAATINGVYKSTNGGSSYTVKNSGITVTQILALAIDPNAPTTLYAGTVLGIYKTTNGGDSWVEVKGGITGPSPRVNEIVLDPTNSSIVYMGTSRGMFKTTNGGTFWNGINGGLSSQSVNALGIDPDNPLTLYAGLLSSTDVVFKTTDGGATWAASGAGLTYTVGGQPFTPGINALAVDPQDPEILYAATSGGGMYKTTNGGANWSQSNTGLANRTVTAVTVDPIIQAKVYAGASIFYDAFAVKLNPAGSALEYIKSFGGAENDEARGVALDSDGNAYIVGTTSSSNFPAVNAFQPASGGLSDAFVAKLNSAGSDFVYSTYLGGINSDQGRAIAVRAGSAYVTGPTTSNNFPLVTSIKPAPVNFDTDVFVTKLAPSGASLVFSTRLGGASADQGFGLALDSSGAVYVTGSTNSNDFHAVQAPQPSRNGLTDAFVTKLNSAGTAIVYSTYLGGVSNDQGNGIAVDANSDAYIIGSTVSPDFPTVGAFQPALNGPDAFVTKLGPLFDLGLAMSDAPDPVAFGSNLTYTINVKNNGTLAATGVTLTDTLPGGATLVSATTTRGTCIGTTTITCSLGTMNGGEEATVQIVIKPPAVSPINNTATVTSNEVDPVPPNNSATVQTQVNFADLSVTKVTAHSRVSRNGRINYLVNVKNLSGQTANSVTLTDTLPTGTTFVSCSAVGGVCGGSGNNRTVTILPLAVGQSAAIVLVATVNPAVAEGTVLNNTATVSAATPDPNPSNNSATTMVTVTATPLRKKLNGLVAFATDGVLTVKADASEAPIPFPGLSSGIIPRWSPDGSKLAFTVSKNSSTFPFDTITAIDVVNADGTGLVTLAENVISTSFNDRSGFSWSPDGTRVAYVGTDRFIYLANADGSGYVKLPNSPTQVRDIDWSADGSRFVFSKDFGEIYVMNIDGSNLTKLVPFGNGPDGTISYLGPTWSPDMTRILFAGVSNNNADVLIMNSNGTGQQRLLNREFTSSPAWSPDGTRVGFYNGLDLYVINLDGSYELRLATNQDCCGFGSISWQPIPTNTPLVPTGPPSPTFTISGSITNSNGTSEGALLKLSGTRSGAIFTVTGSGNYTIVNLPAGGTYTITPTSPYAKFAPASRTFTNLQQNKTGVDFVATTFSPTVKGRLTDITGQPLPGEPVSLFGATRLDTTTDAQGFYTFTNVFPGYARSVTPLSLSFSFDPVSAFFEALFSDTTVNFVGAANASVRSLGGRITDSSNRALAGRLVTLSGARNAVTKTNSDGQFTFANLPVGQNYTMTPSTAGGFAFSPPQQTFTNLNTSQGVSFTATISQPSVQFSAPSYTVNENGHAVQVTATRTGDLSASGMIDYETSDLSASERTDYTASFGTLRFAPGEASRTFSVLVSDDTFVEGARTFSVTLLNGSGVVLGANPVATVIITDDDTVPSSTNPVNGSSFFVRQHYADFLNRVPDASGLQFWINEIESCGANAACREVKRINVSAAFFLSIEFQETGYLVYRIHHAAFATAERLKLKSFLRDTQEIGRGVVVGVGNWQLQLEANKRAFMDDFVLRQEFTNIYPISMPPAQFVDSLNANIGAALSTSQRNDLVFSLTSGAKTRGEVLRECAENREFSLSQTNRAFVLMQYFGYLRRNADDPPDSDFAGHAFWLGKLNQFNGNFVEAEMVNAFLLSSEYRQRFGTP